MFAERMDPVVQSIVSVISLTFLAKIILNIKYTSIFFVLKMWVAFAEQKLLTFFFSKIFLYLHITWYKF